MYILLSTFCTFQNPCPSFPHSAMIKKVIKSSDLKHYCVRWFSTAESCFWFFLLLHLHLVTFANSWRMKSGSRIFRLALNFPQNSSSALEISICHGFHQSNSLPSHYHAKVAKVNKHECFARCFIIHPPNFSLSDLPVAHQLLTMCTNLSSISPPTGLHSFYLAAQINNFLNSQIASD